MRLFLCTRLGMPGYDKLIEISQLERIIDDDNCRLVDCRFSLLQPDRGREDYLAGHIPGAVYADLDKDLAGPVSETTGRHPLPATQDFRSLLEGFGIDATTQVVAYDDASGAIAARLWWMLRWVGHAKAAVLNGGLKAWTAVGGALDTTIPEFAKTSYPVSPQNELVASTAEISSVLTAGKPLVLVDARDAPRFTAQTEPIDTVAGHVPGALNLPFSSGLHADGSWKPAAELQRTWNALLGNEPPSSVVVMCGSGVTACHLALSAEIAGMASPRVYVGSWSEWIRDPSRPVARS